MVFNGESVAFMILGLYLLATFWIGFSYTPKPVDSLGSPANSSSGYTPYCIPFSKWGGSPLSRVFTMSSIVTFIL